MSHLLWEYERVANAEKAAEAALAAAESDLIKVRRQKAAAWRAYVDSLPTTPSGDSIQAAIDADNGGRP